MTINHNYTLYKIRRHAATSAMMQTSDGFMDMHLDQVAVDGPKTTPFERRFNPYDFNGG